MFENSTMQFQHKRIFPDAIIPVIKEFFGHEGSDLVFRIFCNQNYKHSKEFDLLFCPVFQVGYLVSTILKKKQT